MIVCVIIYWYVCKELGRLIIVGLTGVIGSGKSTVSHILSELGAYTIDADEISRTVLDKDTPAYFETVEHFGREILSCDGTINRKELAKIVFNNKAELEVLNRITHKYIFIKMQNMIDKYISASGSGDMIVLDVPLLFSDDFNIKYDKSVVVTASREIIIKRVMLRDGMDESEILERIKNQLSDEELIKRADYVIENNYENIDELRICVTGIYDELISLNT